MKARTKRFALECLRIVDGLPRNRACEVYGKQLIRSSSSVGANYRAVCRSKSDADMVAKLSIVEEEADESGYWLELLIESGNLRSEDAAVGLRESDEITAIVVASRKTIRKRMANGNRESTMEIRN